MAVRYCGPASTNWRLGVVGSTWCQYTSSNCLYDTTDGSNKTCNPSGEAQGTAGGQRLRAAEPRQAGCGGWGHLHRLRMPGAAARDLAVRGVVHRAASVPAGQRHQPGARPASPTSLVRVQARCRGHEATAALARHRGGPHPLVVAITPFTLSNGASMHLQCMPRNQQSRFSSSYYPMHTREIV